MKKNLTIQSANKEILRRVRPIGSVKRLLTAACGYTIAENIRAPFDLPSFDNAAMDGYAVRADNLASHAPVTLLEIGVALAGKEFRGEVGSRWWRWRRSWARSWRG